AALILILTGSLSTKPIGKLRLGNSPKLAKSNKLSLQWVSLPIKKKVLCSTWGALLFGLGKSKKS
ncbi:19811_t:CDS:1, partial [Funneliformis geosporum]